MLSAFQALASLTSRFSFNNSHAHWPTQPFILSGSISEQWAGIRCVLPCIRLRHLVKATG